MTRSVFVTSLRGGTTKQSIIGYSESYVSARKAASLGSASRLRRRLSYWPFDALRLQKNTVAKNDVWPRCQHTVPNPDQDRPPSTLRKSLKYKAPSHRLQRLFLERTSPNPNCSAKAVCRSSQWRSFCPSFASVPPQKPRQ